MIVKSLRRVPDEHPPATPIEQHDPLALLARRGRLRRSRSGGGTILSSPGWTHPHRSPMITDAMAELRMIMDQSAGDRDREARREGVHAPEDPRGCEARTRTRGRGVRRLARAGAALAAATCSRGRAHTAGAPRRKITLTWVPWTHQRLAYATGYGAGIASPGWYHHLWTAPDRPIVRWLAKVRAGPAGTRPPGVQRPRHRSGPAGGNLGRLRRRPLAGLAEVTEATRAVLCDGDELAVRYVTDHLVVGQALGSVNRDVPTVPLEADLTRTCRTLRVRREARVRFHDLDLRRPIDQARSQLFHRLRLLGLRWIVPAESSVQSQGTFRETWQSRWEPSIRWPSSRASVWGTTVESAASARVDKIIAEGSLVELTETVERCLLADLPGALDRLLATLADKAALDADVVHLMDALPALARAQRYGDVRQTDTRALRKVSEVLVVRICAGLQRAVASLDATNAATMRRRIDAVNTAIGLPAANRCGTDGWTPSRR